MGTWTVIERPETRNYALAMPGQEHTLDLQYQVRWTPASSGDAYPGDQQMYQASGLPGSASGCRPASTGRTRS